MITFNRINMRRTTGEIQNTDDLKRIMVESFPEEASAPSSHTARSIAAQMVAEVNVQLGNEQSNFYHVMIAYNEYIHSFARCSIVSTAEGEAIAQVMALFAQKMLETGIYNEAQTVQSLMQFSEDMANGVSVIQSHHAGNPIDTEVALAPVFAYLGQLQNRKN